LRVPGGRADTCFQCDTLQRHPHPTPPKTILCRHHLPRMPMVLEGAGDLASILTDMAHRNAGCVAEGEPTAAAGLGVLLVHPVQQREHLPPQTPLYCCTGPHPASLHAFHIFTITIATVSPAKGFCYDHVKDWPLSVCSHSDWVCFSSLTTSPTPTPPCRQPEQGGALLPGAG
jgi:hypothetical protein